MKSVQKQSLDQDLAVMEGSTDKFGQLLAQLISDCIGPEYGHLAEVKYERIVDKTVCIVDVDKAPEPAFLSWAEREAVLCPGWEYIACSGSPTNDQPHFDELVDFKYVHSGVLRGATEGLQAPLDAYAFQPSRVYLGTKHTREVAFTLHRDT